MKRYLALVVLAWFVAVAGAPAQTLDDQYVQVFNLIQEADSLSSGQPAQALAKYVEAQTALQRIQKTSPDWNPKVVNFRLSYVGEKIAALSAKAPPVVTPGPATTAAEKVSGKRKEVPPDWEEQVTGLRDQVTQLQADKVIMETKLKEALSVQPADNDPQELVRTQKRLSELQKENELLKVSLEKAKPAETADPKALTAAQQSLADANRKLAAETARADALTQEKKVLQTKLDNMASGAWNSSKMAGTKGEIDRLNRQLTEQKETVAKLEQTKAASEKRLKALSADAEAASALRAENELLKKQLAGYKSAEKEGPGGNLATQLAEARTQLAALQSDKEVWRLEKIALENRVRQLGAAAPATSSGAAVAPAPAVASADAARVQELERERDSLRKQLDVANKELAGRKGKNSSPKVEDLETQLANVKARLEVYEARQVPYTAEELALFTRSQPKVVEPDPAKKSIRELSPASAKLAIEARQRYNAGELDKAEEAYVKLVKQDDKNVAALVNLASTQLARNNVAAAEKTVQQALTLAPDSAYALSVLGRVRVTQKRLDDALDAFGRAAKLDPQNPELQNFLGLTLSEKGLRGPAESALRKAVQLDPKYADAHKNLAVIYLTQSPPLAELARWHYQKSLAVGAPRSPDLEKMLEAKERTPAK